MGGWLFNTFMDTRLKEREKEFETIPLFNFFYQFVGGIGTFDSEDEILNDIISTIDIKQTSDHNWETRRVDLLHIYFNIFL
jgi:hypothetical protein